MDEIVAFAELEQFIDLPVRTYSSGMYMRLGFAVAAHIQADVLLLDEVFAVGDEEFQRKCFGKIYEFKQRGGTIVFVSHDASSVERLCERAVLLRDGGVEFDGSAQEAIARYHQLLADERDPAESGAGLQGVGKRRGADRRRPPARPRRRGAARSSRPASRSPLPCASSPGRRAGAASSRSSCATRPACCSPARAGHRRARLGGAPGERCCGSQVERPPLADGRFRLRFELGDRTGRRLYHWLDDAVAFVVYPPARRAAWCGSRALVQGGNSHAGRKGPDVS